MVKRGNALAKQDLPAPRRRTILIVDPDPEFHKALSLDTTAARCPPSVAKTGREAQSLLADQKNSYSGVFVSFKVTDPGGVSVIRSAHQHRPATPIYAISEGPSPFSDPELKRLGVRKALL